jgi:hypothetical protein
MIILAIHSPQQPIFLKPMSRFFPYPPDFSGLYGKSWVGYPDLGSFRTSVNPVVDKDEIESIACSHKKPISNPFRKPLKDHPWIDPRNDIDFTAVPLWLRV